MRLTLSICIVVRNAAADLALTLASLDRQLIWLSQLSTEVVIIDGCSNDASAEIAQNWADRCILPVCFLSQPPQGIYPAMNLAWRQAQGDWLVFINSGDLLLDAEPLAAALAAANVANFKSIQFQAAVFMPGSWLGMWIPGRPPACHQSLVYRRELHSHCGPYDVRLSICADTLFDQHIRSHGRLWRPDVLAATQVSPANASRTPGLIRQDLITIQALGLSFRPFPRPWLSLLILSMERWIGCSVSVWLRLGVLRLIGKARMVSLG